MINGDLVHPEILKALASMGHYSKVLVVDANFPVATHTSEASTRVFLNYAPGILDVPTVLEPLLQTIVVEAAAAVVPDSGNEPPVFADYRRLLPGMDIQHLSRDELFILSRTGEVKLVIATADKRPFSCIVLTLGARKLA
jgi:L-fucose mutarotase